LYLERFLSRLKTTNLQYIRRILMVLNALLKTLSVATTAANTPLEELMTINQFLFSLHIDHINMFKIGAYLQESELARKVYARRLCITVDVHHHFTARSTEH
jgi:chromosome transmission fidelity protein 1